MIRTHFAEQSLVALQASGQDFEALDLDSRFHNLAWDDEAAWAEIRKDRNAA